MFHQFTKRAASEYAAAPREIQHAFDRRLAFLLKNIHHPSLHAKKYDEASDIWQARITKGWRFYFQIRDDTYVILSIIRHPK